jgi:hypothetical protein
MYQFGSSDGGRYSPPPHGTASSANEVIGSAASASAVNSSSEKGMFTDVDSSVPSFTLTPFVSL